MMMTMTTIRRYTAAVLMVAGMLLGSLATPGQAQTTEPPDALTIDRIIGQPAPLTARSLGPANAEGPDAPPANPATTDTGTIASRERALVLRYRRLRDRASRYGDGQPDRIRYVGRPAFANTEGAGNLAGIDGSRDAVAPALPMGTSIRAAAQPLGRDSGDSPVLYRLIAELRALADRLEALAERAALAGGRP